MATWRLLTRLAFWQRDLWDGNRRSTVFLTKPWCPRFMWFIWLSVWKKNRWKWVIFAIETTTSELKNLLIPLLEEEWAQPTFGITNRAFSNLQWKGIVSVQLAHLIYSICRSSITQHTNTVQSHSACSAKSKSSK